MDAKGLNAHLNVRFCPLLPAKLSAAPVATLAWAWVPPWPADSAPQLLRMWDLLSSGPSSPPPAPPPPQQLLPQRVFTEAVLPFVERAGKQNFSLIEVGSWNGVYSLELAARYARSTLLVLEPNRSVWEQHTALATRSRRAHLAVLNTAVNEEVAEALAHSNEFLDMQLLVGLQSSRPFDHGVSVSVAKREALDRFVAHLLSMARRTLVMLPVATAQRDECRDNRLANWVDGAPAARLEAAAATLKMRLHTQRVLQGVAADGCPHEVWELGLAYMDRVNRHHFCLGGCKTHTRRSYRLIYSSSRLRLGLGLGLGLTLT